MSSSGEQSIQDGSRELQWEGQWAVEENDQYDGGSWHVTRQSGATVSFSVSGTNLYIYGGSGPDYGSFSVQCDDEGVINNARTKSEHVQVLLFQRDNWKGGQHSCMITNLEDSLLAIDKLVVSQEDESSVSPVASLSTTRTRQTTSTESSTDLELPNHSSSSRNSSSSTTVSSTTRPSSSDVLTESTSSLDVSSLSDDSSSEDQGGGSTAHNAALIGGIAGGAVLLTALIFFIWRCAKQRDDRQRRESGQWDTAQSEDGGEKANTMRDISNPILKSSTLDPLSNAREHHVQFPWQSDRASDDGSIFKEEAAGRASTAPVSAFTYADGSNVDLAALPRRADSPALSFRTDTSAETKRSIPRVPPPAESLPPPIPVAAAFSHPYQQKMSNPRLPTLSTVPNPRDSAASSGSHWTLAAGSAEHLPGQAFTTDLPRDRQSEANEEFTFKRLPPITSVLGPDEEVLKSPAAKKNGRQRSATLTWLRGPWD